MIRTLPGGISAAAPLTSTHSCIANQTTAMLHVMHILSGYPISEFPEIRKFDACCVLARRSCFYPDIRISGNPDIRISAFPDIRISEFPENPGLTNRGSGNARICSICSILVVLLAMHVYALVNASAAEMPLGRVRIIWYLRYLSSGTLKNTI